MEGEEEETAFGQAGEANEERENESQVGDRPAVRCGRDAGYGLARGVGRIWLEKLPNSSVRSAGLIALFYTLVVRSCALVLVNCGI